MFFVLLTHRYERGSMLISSAAGHFLSYADFFASNHLHFYA
jgi:hypothetical protein